MFKGLQWKEWLLFVETAHQGVIKSTIEHDTSVFFVLTCAELSDHESGGAWWSLVVLPFVPW